MLDLIRLADGNPGALTFIMEAGKMFDERADKGFKRMQAHNITGSKLYILWNDCCDRNTEKAIRVMYEEKMRNIISEKVAEFELDIESIKAEAIKEFAERLKNLVHHTVFSSVYGTMLSISENNIDNLVKEMLGE